MKTKKTYAFVIRQLLCLALLPLIMMGCLYEHPELTENGELGIDPTGVNVTAELSLKLKLNDTGSARSDTRAEQTHRHRIIVDAYLDRELAARQVVYKELTNAEELTATVNMQLHARNYQLVVWADYVEAGSEKDLYYDTTTLIPAINADPYIGNVEQKDVLYGNQPLELSPYRNEWNTKVSVYMELKRPVARYELVADDVAKFLKKINDQEITGKKFTLTVRYTNFFYTGFNALDEITKSALQYISYSRNISVPTGDLKELSIGLDYVFVSDGKAEIPIAVEVTDDKSNLIARTYLLLSCKAGQSQTIRSNFLTADPSGGVGFDPDYDGSINDKVEVE